MKSRWGAPQGIRDHPVVEPWGHRYILCQSEMPACSSIGIRLPFQICCHDNQREDFPELKAAQSQGLGVALGSLYGHLRRPTTSLWSILPSEHIQGQCDPFCCPQCFSRGHVSVREGNQGSGGYTEKLCGWVWDRIWVTLCSWGNDYSTGCWGKWLPQPQPGNCSPTHTHPSTQGKFSRT